MNDQAAVNAGFVFPCEHGSLYSHVLNPEAVGNHTESPVVCVGRPVQAPHVEELRKALAWYADMTYLDDKDVAMVAAARSWLSLLEGDEATVERGVRALENRGLESVDRLPNGVIEDAYPMTELQLEILVRAVIAAVIEGSYE